MVGSPVLWKDAGGAFASYGKGMERRLNKTARSQVQIDGALWEDIPGPDAATGPNAWEPERDAHPHAFGGID